MINAKYKKHKLIVNNPELWKQIGFSEKEQLTEKELKHLIKK